MVAFDIHRVLYEPQKAFKDIVKNPKYYGVIIIAILYIIAGVGSEYVRDTRIFVQQTFPSSLDFNNPDPWTDNATYWHSNAVISNNTVDYILDQSVQFNVTNDARIAMSLDNISPVDCTDSGGYRNFTFALKWIHLSARPPENASLFLNSTSSPGYFYHNLTSSLVGVGNDRWFNFTIPVGPSASDWTSNASQASWSNINEVKIELNWLPNDRANITVRLDKMYFLSDHFDQVTNILGTVGFTQLVFSATLDFGFNLLLFSIVLYFVSKFFHIETTFKTLVIILGYSLIGMVVLKALFAIYYLLMPTIYFYFSGIQPLSAYDNLFYFLFFSTLVLPIWSLILAAIAIHTGFEKPWANSLLMAVIAFAPYYILQLLGGLGF